MTVTLFDAINNLGLSYLATGESIAQRSQPMNTIMNPGVYFLMDGSRIVYVGQSVTPEHRIIVHARDKSKTFDSFYIHRCYEEYLDLLETLFILHYNPRHNGLPSSLPLNSKFSVISKKVIKAYLSDTPFTLNDLKKWESQDLIKPVVHYRNMTYYWLADYFNVINIKINEYGEEKYHSRMESVRRYKERLRTQSTLQKDDWVIAPY